MALAKPTAYRIGEGQSGARCGAGFRPGLCRLGVKTGSYRTATLSSASPRLTDITDSRVLPVLPVTEPLGRYVPATLAPSKGRLIR
jgi:hypothetical protein